MRRDMCPFILTHRRDHQHQCGDNERKGIEKCRWNRIRVFRHIVFQHAQRPENKGTVNNIDRLPRREDNEGNGNPAKTADAVAQPHAAVDDHRAICAADTADRTG